MMNSKIGYVASLIMEWTKSTYAEGGREISEPIGRTRNRRPPTSQANINRASYCQACKVAGSYLIKAPDVKALGLLKPLGLMKPVGP